MSATKRQEQLVKGTSWLTQLRVNAEYAECDASVLAQERFKKPRGDLTVVGAQALVWELNGIIQRKAEAKKTARTPVSGPHSHICNTCDESVECYRDDCRETVGEHRYCHEGFGRQEFDRTFRDNF
jgi:hypothetical protein